MKIPIYRYGRGDSADRHLLAAARGSNIISLSASPYAATSRRDKTPTQSALPGEILPATGLGSTKHPALRWGNAGCEVFVVQEDAALSVIRAYGEGIVREGKIFLVRLVGYSP